MRRKNFSFQNQIINTIAEIRSLSSQHVTPLKNIDLRDMVRGLLGTFCK